MSKNSKYQTHEKPKRRIRCSLAQAPGALKEGSFRIFQHPLLQNIKKLKGEKTLENKNFSESLTMPKKLKGGPLGFFNIHSVAEHQKIEGGTFEEFFSEKVSMPKKN